MKTVLITGGSGGIGSAAARAFHADGWDVVLQYCQGEAEIGHLLAELPNARAFRADFRDRAQVEALADAFPQTDVLINNAAVDLFSLFDLVNREQEQTLYGVNLFAPLTLTRRLLKGMLSRGHGVILNVSSVFGEGGGSCEVDYATSKAALIGLTRALAKEVGPAGVRVNCVCPGVIDTRMNDRLTVEEAQTLADGIALERFGRPEEVADALLFLASDKASYITGAVLDVNGGY